MDWQNCLSFMCPTIVGHSTMTFAIGLRGNFLANLMLTAATFVAFCGFTDICFVLWLSFIYTRVAVSWPGQHVEWLSLRSFELPRYD